LDRSLRENFALANDATLTRRGRLLRALEAARFRHHADALRMKYTDDDQAARGLSGGNQQKLVLARWLQRDAEVLILDEPTRGIDVGARYEIYILIRELAARGKSLLVISSDLPEVLGICDRVLVLHEGRLTADLAVEGLTQEQLLSAALGQGALA
ncbi:MAG: ATP-binding cassette domain-containing protein, partial [Planctomycetota bacterium]|nr:ATP-binding cassette domain-containing protein [Planctomycetota bacterium]